MDDISTKKRRYGYVGREKPSSVKAGSGWGARLFFYCLIPFKVVLWLLKLLLRPFGFWRQRPKHARRLFWKRIGTVALTLGVIGFLFGVVAVVWLGKDLPNPDELTDRTVRQSTKLYDRSGQHLLYEILIDNSKKRTVVPYEKLPANLINGVVATEDKIFFEHYGVRPLSMLRAVVYGALPGQRTRGTSTLTQQLVKNVMLTNERSYTRKVKEIILSLLLEQRYSKEQILQIYFNEIPYGGTNYGVETAAQTYFHKSVEDVTLAEAAVLAGLPQQPSRFLRDREALQERRNFVLRRMYEEGYITEEEKVAAQAEPLNIQETITNIEAPHFVFYVISELEKMFGEEQVNSGGLKVITTLDWDKQQIAGVAVKEESEKIFKEAGANNAALVAINPRNGEVLSMIGSRNFTDETINGQFNVAVDGPGRQPGSSFKPIVYAAAFEKGYTPDTVLFDVVTNFAVSGPEYKPLNYNLKEYGLVTMRQALQGSLNIPAVKTLYLVGQRRAIEFAQRMGYTTLDTGDFGLSLVLGGGEVHLLDHTSAYGVFANSGIRHVAHGIIEVRDANGDALFKYKNNKGEQVIDATVANTISNVLSDDAARAFIFSSGGQLTLKDRPVAAKTGTTNNYKDAWTMGYTPSLVTGVWVGNTDNTEMNRGFGGTSAAAPIWNRFMREALANTPIEQFPPLPPNDAQKPVLRGGTGGITLSVDKATGKLATSSTPASYIVPRTYIPPHDILHYVNKDDPRGPAPTDPSIDPQYSVWEAAIQDWIRRRKEAEPTWEVSFEEPPTEYDDLHSLELIPSLTVVYPLVSTTLTSRQIDTDVRVSAPRGVTQVTYKIDERYVGVVRSHPFNLNYYARELESGPHTLTIRVEDDIGTAIEETIPFTLNAPEEPALVTWAGQGQEIGRHEFPRVFFLNLFKVEDIESVTFRVENTETHSNASLQPSTITDFSNLFNDQITVTWREAPAAGTWNLVATTKRKSGGEGIDTLRVTVK